MAVCHTVDVYLDRCQLCVFDPKCLCFRRHWKSDVVHTQLCSEEIGAACFFFFLNPSHILGLKTFILQSSLNSTFAFLSPPLLSFSWASERVWKLDYVVTGTFVTHIHAVSRFWFLDWRHWQWTLHWILATSVGSCWVDEGVGHYLLVEPMQ